MAELATIAIDAMGGDFGPDVIVPAAAQVVKKRRNVHIILVGDRDKIQASAARHGVVINDRIEIHHASEVVEMHDEPGMAIRKKKRVDC